MATQKKLQTEEQPLPSRSEVVDSGSNVSGAAESWLSKVLPILVWISAAAGLSMVAIRLSQGLGRDFLFALTIIVVGSLGLRKGLSGLTRDVAVLAVIAGLFGYALGHFN